jgi:hypothetical protein
VVRRCWTERLGVAHDRHRNGPRAVLPTFGNHRQAAPARQLFSIRETNVQLGRVRGLGLLGCDSVEDVDQTLQYVAGDCVLLLAELLGEAALELP